MAASKYVVGVPKEIKTDEYRVAMIPVGVEELTRAGHQVLIQAGAGQGSGISDEQYAEQRRRDRRRRRGRLEAGRPDRQGQGAAAGRMAADAAGPDRLHLLPLRRRRAADPGRHGSRASRPSPTRPSSDARGNLPLLDADERGGRPHEHPGRGQVPGTAVRGPRHPAGRRAGRAAGQRGHPRRRRGRRQRGQGGRRPGRQRHHPRHQPRPAALPRRRDAAQRDHAVTATGTTSSTA